MEDQKEVTPTQEQIEDGCKCGSNTQCSECSCMIPGNKVYSCIEMFAKALREEKKKTAFDVWTNAPDNADRAHINLFAGKQILKASDRDCQWFTRELPKTQKRIKAEKMAESLVGLYPRYKGIKGELVEVFESFI